MTDKQQELVRLCDNNGTKEQLIEQMRKVIEESGTIEEFGSGLDAYIEQRVTDIIEAKKQEKLSKKIVNDIEDEWAKDMPLIEETEKEFREKQQKYYKECNMLDRHWIKQKDKDVLAGALYKLQSPLKQKLLKGFINIVCWNTRREMAKLSGHPHPIILATFSYKIFKMMRKLGIINEKH